MHKIRRRAFIVILLVLALCAGTAFYIASYVSDGAKWVALPSNRHLYAGGQLILGTVTDRDGRILAQTVDGKRVYAEDETVRRAMLHLVGDTAGKIGTGVQTKFSGELSGFSPLSGLFFTARDKGELTLTADAEIAAAAYKALGGYNGAVIAYNYRSGAVLCAVSKPGFDPENVPNDLETDPAYNSVYVNRCFGATYTPGSVMKLVTTAAALETVPDILERTFTCTGSVVIGGQRINCQGVHGEIDMRTALAYSCNCAYAEIAGAVGGETLAAYFARCGLDEAFDIDGIRVAPGSIGTFPDGSGELAWAGIGQSTDLASPAAFLRLCGAIANGGVAVTPHILDGAPSKSERLLEADTAAILAEWMRNDTALVYGDASFPAALSGQVCAKSGTAQIDGAASHSWFVGFVSGDRYPVAFAVVAEHAGAGSGVAKNVAAAVLEAVVAG